MMFKVGSVLGELSLRLDPIDGLGDVGGLPHELGSTRLQLVDDLLEGVLALRLGVAVGGQPGSVEHAVHRGLAHAELLGDVLDLRAPGTR